MLSKTMRANDDPEDLGSCGQLSFWQSRRIWKERIGHEALESTRAVLNLPKFQHMIDPMLVTLDGPEQHRGIRWNAELMSGLMDREVFQGTLLPIADHCSDPIVEDLRTTTGQRPQTSISQAFQSRMNREIRHLRQMLHLNGRQRLDMDMGKAALTRRNIVS